MVIPIAIEALLDSLAEHPAARDLGRAQLRKAAKLAARLVTEERGEVVGDGSSADDVQASEVVSAWAQLQAGVLIERLSARDPHADLVALLRAGLADSRVRRSTRPRRFVELDECRQLVDGLRRAQKLRATSSTVERARLLRGPALATELLRVVMGARERVLMSAFYFRLDPAGPSVLLELVQALGTVARSRDVRVLLDGHVSRRAPAGDVNRAAAEELARSGATVRLWRVPSRRLHAFFVVVDDRHVFAGSHNLTAGSLYRYRDVSLGLESAGLARSLAGEFDRLWSESSTASERASVST